MMQASKPDQARPRWRAPVALLALSTVPVLAGVTRLIQLAAGVPGKEEDLRFFASPLPVTLHIVAASVFCVWGAFQLGADRSRIRRRWHGWSGRLLVPCGLGAALSGLWMTQFYPPIGSDSSVLHCMRLAFGSAMTAALVLGLLAIRRRDFRAHEAWMIRSYSIGQGAGTQVLTHLPWLLLAGAPGPLSRAVLMGAGWLINILVAEWIIFRRSSASPAGLGSLDVRPG
ncbi:MAG: DUF2306 domain-containing protein [Caulobacteraceae bacterium]